MQRADREIAIAPRCRICPQLAIDLTAHENFTATSLDSDFMPNLTTLPHLDWHTGVGVLHAHRESRVLGLEEFGEGDVILALDGIQSPLATRHTIQIGLSKHLQVPDGTSLAEGIERYPWQFLNHSCRPNTQVRGRELIALRRIKALEELSFDYETTEWQMTEPFPCRCGGCGGRSVRGFRFLDYSQRVQRISFLSEHLRARLVESLPE